MHITTQITKDGHICTESQNNTAYIWTQTGGKSNIEQKNILFKPFSGNTDFKSKQN